MPAFGLLALITGASGYLGWRSTSHTAVAMPTVQAADPDPAPVPAPTAAPAANPFGRNPVNILLIGTDADPHAGRTDTIIVLTVDLETSRLAALSIPRDTRVELPGHGVQKINAAYPLGGAGAVAQVVADLVREPIDQIARIDLAGFERVVDSVGGVELEVDKRMRYTDRAQGLRINLRPGRQTLNGHEAMQYVRFRKDAEGDLGRIRRQQKFLRALAASVTRPRNLRRLPGTVVEVLRHLETSLSPVQIVALARLLATVDLATLDAAQLPGEARTIDKLSYFLADASAGTMLAGLRGGTSGQAGLTPAVTIYNGSDRIGLERVAAAALRARGLEAVAPAGATIAQVPHTRVYAADADHHAAALRVAALLGVTASSNQAPAAWPPATTTPDTAPVVLVLGADYPR